ncbi:hypothetical protein [Paenibacillus hamazuiensis]|uniref:hypothetical protein n=1 Tax=Paenibacillus hamazuiensis TaxID=2936508 RepID=UPI002010187F|nr:hypothetical protein [Paenibacillus hamazuiensis]
MNHDTAQLQQELQECLGEEVASELVYGLQRLSREELLGLRESFETLVSYLQKQSLVLSNDFC